MKQLAESIWVHEDDMKLGPTELRLRMTIVQLAGGDLWIHSPTALTTELKEQVQEIGSVRSIIGPNNAHNLWISEWRAAFPEAELYVSSGIPKKINVSNYRILDASWQNIWPQDFDHEAMIGVPFFDESVFLHRKTESLIVTDLIQNHSDDRPSGFAGLVTRFMLEPIGFKGKCVAPPLKMGFMIKDKPQFKSFIEKLRRWDFVRIVVTHGEIIETDAKEIFLELTNRFLR
jgi:hypothetical protein|tara:strand:+ start:10052 stop:10744 length:693 start_codon:yes stop_codon:yes gene_type:complete